MKKLALMFGILLLVGPFVNSSRAENGVASADADPPNPPYPGEAHVTFQWDYSCPTGRACSFRCPGAGGANNVTALEIYLGTIPSGNDQHTSALFYNFSTAFVPRANGFIISSGMATLSCQVNGLRLEYSGPPK